MSGRIIFYGGALAAAGVTAQKTAEKQTVRPGLTVLKPSDETSVDPGARLSSLSHIRLSADGSIAAWDELGRFGRLHAPVIWVAGKGRRLPLPAGSMVGFVQGVSADGNVVVGGIVSMADDISAQPSITATRWVDGKSETLAGPNSRAYAASADGTVIFGRANPPSAEEQAFRWTQAEGMTNIGTPESKELSPCAVSSDGSVVVGYLMDAERKTRAFRWTRTEGLTALETPEGHASSATGVSADGSVIVGYSTNAAWRHEAFRWTKETGVTALGTLPGMTGSVGAAVSADGSVIVGTSTKGEREEHAFRWTKETGMQSVEDWLRAHDPSFALNGDDRLVAATGVSADGSIISGIGNGAKDGMWPWIVRVDE